MVLCGLRQFMHTSEIPSQQRLWSFATYSLSVPVVRLSAVGRIAVPVAGVCNYSISLRNDLPFTHYFLTVTVSAATTKL